MSNLMGEQNGEGSYSAHTPPDMVGHPDGQTVDVVLSSLQQWLAHKLNGDM